MHNPKHGCNIINGFTSDNCNYVTFCLDDNYIGIAVNNDIVMVNIKNYKIEIIFRGHDNIVKEVHYIKSENKIISVSDDNTFIIWDIVSKQMCYRSKLFVSQINKCQTSLLVGKIMLYTKNNVLFYSINNKGQTIESNSMDILSIVNDYIYSLYENKESDSPLIVTPLGLKKDEDKPIDFIPFDDKTFFIIDIKYIDETYVTLGTAIKTAMKLKQINNNDYYLPHLLVVYFIIYRF